MNNSAAQLMGLADQFGTADWSRWQRFSQPWYDYVYYPAAGAPTGLSFFAIAAGSRDPNAATGVTKTLEDTNFRTSGQITPNYLKVMEVRTHMRIATKNRQPAGISDNAGNIYANFSSPTVQTQIDLLLRSGVLTINIDNKNYIGPINQPLITAPAGFGVNLMQFGQQAVSAAVVPRYWTQSNPSVDNVYVVDPPILIAPGQIIQAQITFPDANYAIFTNLVNSTSPLIQIGVILNGITYRSAQ